MFTEESNDNKMDVQVYKAQAFHLDQDVYTEQVFVFLSVLAG